VIQLVGHQKTGQEGEILLSEKKKKKKVSFERNRKQDNTFPDLLIPTNATCWPAFMLRDTLSSFC